MEALALSSARKTLHFLPEDEGRGVVDPLGGIGRDHPGGGGEVGRVGTILEVVGSMEVNRSVSICELKHV